MTRPRPRIGIPVDVKLSGNDPIHGVGEKYIAAVAHAAGGIPLLLPALAEGRELASLEAMISPDDLLDGLDGLFLTGSPSNLHPSFYDGNGAGVGPFDPQRDRTVQALLAAAMARDLPILAVCRGFQELNVACGGTLYQAVHDVPSLADHRDDHDAPREARYAPVHLVRLAEGGLLAALAERQEIGVNSLHGQGIDRLADSLQIEATAPDGLIEAARRPDRTFVVGVQWHPEWQVADNPVSSALFAAFGDAASAYRRRD